MRRRGFFLSIVKYFRNFTRLKILHIEKNKRRYNEDSSFNIRKLKKLKRLINYNKYYVFYDGNCGVCNFWVNWILKNDKKNQFLFSPLQSDFGQSFLKKRNLREKQFNTLYLWRPEKFYLKKSNAVIKIAEKLGGINSIIIILKFIPKFIRDFVYDCFAKNRHLVLKQNCTIPNQKTSEKFIN